MLSLVALEKLGQVSGNDRMTLIAWRVILESFHAKAKVDSYLIAHCVVSNIVWMMSLLIIYGMLQTRHSKNKQINIICLIIFLFI